MLAFGLGQKSSVTSGLGSNMLEGEDLPGLGIAHDEEPAGRTVAQFGEDAESMNSGRVVGGRSRHGWLVLHAFSHWSSGVSRVEAHRGSPDHPSSAGPSKRVAVSRSGAGTAGQIGPARVYSVFVSPGFTAFDRCLQSSDHPVPA